VSPLRIESLFIRQMRCLAHVDLRPSPRFNVISGDNGQGKTSILEAIYLVSTTKSFRTARFAELVAHGSDTASVRAEIIDRSERREQRIGLRGGTRHVAIDGKRPASLAEYAVRSPAVVFHPGEMILSAGPASARRTLLDRVALFARASSIDDLQRYGAASRSRSRVLETKSPSAPELDAFEHLMAEHGAAISAARREAAGRIVPVMLEAFGRITHESRLVEAEYRPGGPETAAELGKALRSNRMLDRVRKSPRAGPHRDDLAVRLGGFDARTDASQGEHRAMTLALKVAEMSCIAKAREAYPVLLLDDVSSELDLSRTKLLLEFLGETPGQIFVTTTRPDLLIIGGENADNRQDFVVSRTSGVTAMGAAP
jgi:DNA replication and repair protein RecF